jgi:large subunit ribosomal protein L21
VIGAEPFEVVVAQLEGLDPVDRHDRGRAAARVDQRQVAEVVAGSVGRVDLREHLPPHAAQGRRLVSRASGAAGVLGARLGRRRRADSISRAMYAVIASGGKQEKVTEGQQVALELLEGDEGSEVSLTPVLVVDGDDVLAGTDALSGASVTAKIVGTTKGPKINGFTYKRRTNQRRRYGHRQNYTVVEITSIKKS